MLKRTICKYTIALCFTLWPILFLQDASYGATNVGKTATIKGSVTGRVQGNSRKLVKGKPVYLNERIKASRRSTGQFILLDNSKIAVGAGATIVLDKFVVSSGKKAKRVSLNVLRGALRFSSGRSGSGVYKIVTPTATLGIRGTLFDVTVIRGVTSVLLLRGLVDVCSSTGCKRLSDRCSYAIARRGRPVETGHTKRRRPSSREIDPKLFPFARSQRGLIRGLRAGGGSCFNIAVERKRRQVIQPIPRIPAPVPPPPPRPNPPPNPPKDPPSGIPGNPGNSKPVGNAGTAPGRSADKGADGRGASEQNRNNGNKRNNGNNGSNGN